MINGKHLEITPHALLGDVLKVYPELEETLINIAPKFEKLRNPVLKETIGNVTTLKQVSIIGAVPLGNLINQLRSRVNQNEIKIEEGENQMSTKPDWVQESFITETYDAIIDLENGIHPVAKVTKDILNLSGNDLYKLITPFLPAPLIKMVEDKGFTTFSETIDENIVYTYIKRDEKE